MPTKSLLESAEIHDIVRKANDYGITLNTGSISIDWDQIQARKITNRNATRPRNTIFNEEK